MDRATASGAVGGGFEPRRVHHFFIHSTASTYINIKTITTNGKEQCELPAILDIRPVSIAIKDNSGDPEDGDFDDSLTFTF